MDDPDTGLSCAKETGLQNFPVPSQHYTIFVLVCQHLFEIFLYSSKVFTIEMLMHM